MSNAVVGMKDPNIAKQIISILKQDYGFAECYHAKTGDEVASFIGANTFNALVIDLDIEGLSSSTCFNRLRSMAQHRFSAVMVVAKGNPKERFTLFKDYGPTGLYDGAFSANAFSAKFKTVLRESEYASNLWKELESAAQKLSDDTQVQAWIKLNAAQAPTASLVGLVAGSFFSEKSGSEHLAAGAVQPILKLNAQNPAANLILAQIKFRSAAFASAMSYLTAYSHSVHDLPRSLMKAECHLALRQFAESEKMFRNSLGIDANNARAKAGVSLCELAKQYSAKNKDFHPDFTIAKFFLTALAVMMQNKEVKSPLPYFESILHFCRSQLETGSTQYEIGMLYVDSDKKIAAEWFTKAANSAGKQIPAALDQLKKLKAANAA